MNSRYLRQRRRRSRSPLEEDNWKMGRKYNSVDELTFKRDSNQRSPIGHQERKRPVKTSYNHKNMKRSYSNFDFEKLKSIQEMEEFNRRKERKKKSSSKSKKNFYESLGASYKRKHRTRADYSSNMSYGRNQKNDYGDIEANLNYMSTHSTGKMHKKSNSLKTDLISKYFKPRKRNQKSSSIGNLEGFSSGVDKKSEKSKGYYSRKKSSKEGDYTGSSLINRTLDRHNLKDSIMRKYRTNDFSGYQSNTSNVKNAELYKRYMKKKIIANALDKNSWSSLQNDKRSSKHKKSKTLSDFPKKILSNSFYSRAAKKSKMKRIRSGMIHQTHDLDNFSTYSKNIDRYKQRAKKRKSSSKRRKRKKSKQSTSKMDPGVFNSTSMASFGHGKTSSVKKHGKKSRSKEKFRREMSNSIGQIKISEFESNEGLAKRRRKSKKSSYPNIESIQKSYYKLPPFEKSKVIVKKFGNIHSFSVNTHQGTVRNYNEDRVSILLNAQQRFENLITKGVEQCSMFAVYDGHGGERCCNFLKENLHSYIFTNFDKYDLKESIKQSCEAIDEDFMNKAWVDNSCDTSGSCALALISIDDKIVFVNVGDSRAILSRKRGKELQICTYDHKPQFFGEMQRILKNNGQLYRVCSNQKTQETEIYYASTRKEFLEIERIPEETHGRIFGPWRAKPGGLSVSRTFGDIESKKEELGGTHGVIVPTPEITIFNYSDDIDYALLGCDGIFDVLTNEEVNEIIWETVRYHKDKLGKKRMGKKGNDNLAICLNDCVNNLLMRSLIQNSEDNVTVILVAFKNLLDEV